MKIYFASDHAGFLMKDELIPFVKSLGFEVEDCGAFVFNKEDAVRFLSSHEYPLSEIKMSLETAIAWEKLLF